MGALEWGFAAVDSEETLLDLLASSTNALSSAILVRRPDHYRNFTMVGVLVIAVFGGIGGSLLRDLLVGRTPVVLINPVYILSCLFFGILGYRIALNRHNRFREGVFQCVTSFALSWYALVGVKAAVDHELSAVGALAVGVVAATGGRYFVDVTCGVPAIQFIRNEWFVATATLAGVVWLICTASGLHGATGWVAALIAFILAFLFRSTALHRGWREPLAIPPSGVHRHRWGGILLGRRLTDKSNSQLEELGLVAPRHDADPEKPG